MTGQTERTDRVEMLPYADRLRIRDLWYDEGDEGWVDADVALAALVDELDRLGVHDPTAELLRWLCHGN